MSCLFDSLGYHLHVNSRTLRQSICDYMERDPFIGGCPVSFWVWARHAPSGVDYNRTSSTVKQLFRDYVERMRHPSEWGTGIEIQSFCEKFKVHVIVENIRHRDQSQGNKTIEFLSSPPSSSSGRILTREAVDSEDANGEAGTEARPVYRITWSGLHYEPVKKPPPYYFYCLSRRT
jgi:hypothetical protein